MNSACKNKFQNFLFTLHLMTVQDLLSYVCIYHCICNACMYNYTSWSIVSISMIIVHTILICKVSNLLIAEHLHLCKILSIVRMYVHLVQAQAVHSIIFIFVNTS